MARLVFSKNIYEDLSLNQWKGESPCFREHRFYYEVQAESFSSFSLQICSWESSRTVGCA
ncbi:hypothetical protein V6Z12_A11G290300 [Gossypium hirsutum]